MLKYLKAPSSMPSKWEMRSDIVKPSKEFLSWLQTEDDKKIVENIANETEYNQTVIDNKAKDIKTTLTSGKTLALFRLQISSNHRLKQLDLLCLPERTSHTNIQQITHTIQKDHLDKIENLNIRKLSLSSGGIKKHLTLKNCWIDKLILTNGQSISVNLINCEIGNIEFQPTSTENITIENCVILSVKCSNPESGNPFLGLFFIKGTNYFPKTENEYKGQTVGHHNYAFARYHLSRIHNVEATSLFHSIELRLEKPYQTKTVKFFNSLYGLFSDYGQSIGRPLLTIVFITMISTVVFLPPLSLQTTKDSPSWANGVQKSCIEQKNKALTTTCLIRSSLHSVEPILNPLGVVTGAKNFTPTKWPWEFFQYCQRLLLTISVFLLFLALRRKFRIQT